MPSLESGDSFDRLSAVAVALVALVVVGDLLLAAVPGLASDALRFLLVSVVLLAGAVVVATGAVGLPQSPVAALGALLVLPLVAVYAYTGVLLPWTQLSFTIGQTLVELTLSVPVVGDLLAQLLFAGFTLSQATLERAFTLHYAVVALAGLALSVTVARAVGGEPQRDR